MSKSLGSIGEKKKIDEEILRHLPRWGVELLKITEEVRHEVKSPSPQP